VDREVERQVAEAFEANDRRQRMSALEIAQSVRRDQKIVRALFIDRKLDPIAAIKGTLRDESNLAPEVCDRVEAVVDGWNLERLVGTVPGIGPAKRSSVLEAFYMSTGKHRSPRTKTRELSYQERSLIANLVQSTRVLTMQRSADPDAGWKDAYRAR
jgi:hypothetical protein